MKRHGFTLIELVVVIAIIGVLAAILVPAMLGYVRRSKITTANNAARSIYNALNVAMVEMEAYDLPPQQLANRDIDTTGADIIAQKDYALPSSSTNDYNTLLKILYCKVCGYFSDVGKIQDISFRLRESGCIGTGVVNGKYPGTYPLAITVEDYKRRSGSWTSQNALAFALKDPTDESIPDAPPAMGEEGGGSGD